MMRRDRTVEVDGISFTAKELTVSEITAWVDSHLRPDDDMSTYGLVAMMMPVAEGVVLKDLEVLTDLSAEQLQGIGQSALEAIAAKCKEVNAGFFALAARVAASEAAAGLVKIESALSSDSAASSPSSTGTAAA